MFQYLNTANCFISSIFVAYRVGTTLCSNSSNVVCYIYVV